MNRSQSLWESVAGSAVPAEETEEHPHRGPVVPPGLPALGGRHLLTVDVKQLRQRERLGLGVLPAVQPQSAPRNQRRRTRPPVASPADQSRCSQRPGEPATVLSPLHLVEAGLRIRKHPDPVPAPLAGAVASADFVSCVPSFDSSSKTDCTICAQETSRRPAISASWPTSVRARSRLASGWFAGLGSPRGSPSFDAGWPP